MKTMSSHSRELFVSMLSMTILMIINSNLTVANTNNIINLVSLGAKSGGTTDSSAAFRSAWTAACASAKPSTIYLPRGKYLVSSSLIFSGGKCKSKNIRFVIKGTIVAPADFRVLGNSDGWFAFEDVDGVSISGGVFDGRGTNLWACKKSGKSCPSGAATILFTKSMNIRVHRVTSINSQLGHIAFNGCKNVLVQGAIVSASGESPNTDGIHVQLSSGVTILNSKIATGDDCVSIGAGTSNLWIENMSCGPGHGISIGSLAKDLNEPGVQNVTVNKATFTNTQNGVRIKSWGRPSNGFVRNILFQHITMVNAHNPIFIDQNYCPRQQGCPGKVSGITISDVSYEDIHGSSATPIAVKFDCSSKGRCNNIKLEDVNLTYNNQNSQAFCVNAMGTASGLIDPKGCL